eukprot:s4065_g3.t2
MAMKLEKLDCVFGACMNGFRGLSKGLQDDDCKEELKKREQARLRQVVVDCLKRIWESGVGGEVLKIALEAVKSRINRFKAKAGEKTDIIEAMAGLQAATSPFANVCEKRVTFNGWCWRSRLRAGNPPERFAEAFRIACSEVVALPHAGEIAPGPGLGPASDAQLNIASLRQSLDICPSSNELLGVVAVKDSPLTKFLEAGVPCSINSDDPLLFGPSLLEEFQRCRDQLKMSDNQLADCAANSFRHSRAPEQLKQRGLLGIEASHQWAQLEDLVQTIEEHEKSGAARQNLGPIEGRRTKLVIERALENLGGQASSRQVIEWIEQHPEELEKIREAKLNWHVRDGHRKPVWHSTVSSSMHHFRKITKPGQPTMYLAPNAEAPEELPAIQDAPDVAAPAAPAARKPRKRPNSEKAAEGEAPEPKPKRSRKAKAKPKPQADAGEAAPVAAADAPPEAAAPAVPAGPAAPAPEVRPRSPQRKKKADDPLSLLLDAAFEAADKAQ